MRFTADDGYLVTLGQFNRAVVQYKLKRLGADENGVGVLVTPDADLPPAGAEAALEEKDDLDLDEDA